VEKHSRTAPAPPPPWWHQRTAAGGPQVDTHDTRGDHTRHALALAFLQRLTCSTLVMHSIVPSHC
jgi:hypothetical protein